MQAKSPQLGKKPVGNLVEEKIHIAYPNAHDNEQDDDDPILDVHLSRLQVGDGEHAAQKRIHQKVHSKAHQTCRKPQANLLLFGPGHQGFIVFQLTGTVGQSLHHVTKELPLGRHGVNTQGMRHAQTSHAKLIHGPKHQAKQKTDQTRLRTHRSAEKQGQKGRNDGDMDGPIGVGAGLLDPLYRIDHGLRVGAVVLMEDSHNQSAADADDDGIIRNIQIGGQLVPD